MMKDTQKSEVFSIFLTSVFTGRVCSQPSMSNGRVWKRELLPTDEEDDAEITSVNDIQGTRWDAVKLA